MADLNRYEWLKAVLQLPEVAASTKNVAAALAIEFANDETGKICPALPTLAEYLKLSIATIKRAIRELVTLGWLDRSEGRGAGNFTRYLLKSPGKIIPFRNRKKGSQQSLQAQKKGAPVNEKGIIAEPSYKEQSFEQKSAGGSERRDGKPSAPPRAGSTPVFVAQSSWAGKCWREFCSKMFGRDLNQLVEEVKREGQRGYLLPCAQPPWRRADWPVFRADLLTAGFGQPQSRSAA
ncbi:helix-turn-helix domain-containing protein [uncultured Celeribacter sp.]|uniref:helix-turn-helix domain-containing protein n=1 Tax=uncultured Celeribacter sp. TaxID=1303376 RepID=UPI002AA7D9E4|nr:helix-turn-helix domain-containing protein [uncultured Celeribacter sp.]